MPANRLRMVVGLGNPGNKYEDTRHNAGFMVADKIARDFNIALNKTKFDAIFGRGFIQDVEVLLVKPMAFMNRSGPPLQKLAHYFRITGEDMLVIQIDDRAVFLSRWRELLLDELTDAAIAGDASLAEYRDLHVHDRRIRQGSAAR